MDLKPFITGRMALEDVVQGFDTLINHKDTAAGGAGAPVGVPGG